MFLPHGLKQVCHWSSRAQLHSQPDLVIISCWAFAKSLNQKLKRLWNRAPVIGAFMNDIIQVGGRGQYFWDTRYKYVSNIAILVWQKEEGVRKVKICITSFMNDLYSKIGYFRAVKPAFLDICLFPLENLNRWPMSRTYFDRFEVSGF